MVRIWRKLRLGRHLSRARNRVLLLVMAGGEGGGGGKVAGVGRAKDGGSWARMASGTGGASSGVGGSVSF